VKTGRSVFEKVTVSDLPNVAREIAAQLKEVSVWLFHGDLGAGKTTLIKALGQELGIEDAMSSPTFAIVNEYHSQQYQAVFHFDFYRIKSELEAFDIGVEEYFDSGHPCLIEWGEKIPSLLPEERGEVWITIENETTRTIAISIHVGKEENRI
jgi:tRNA threonylcarbamoyladenosine biosynthesis protein TsaE